MEITERNEQGITIATLTGKLGAEDVPAFQKWFDDRMSAGQNCYILNFGGISYLSSAGVRVILSTQKTVVNSQGILAICGLYGMARQVFQVTGLLEVMQVFPDVAESLAAIKKPSA
jgi:anti-anti-sigma factor